MAGRQNHLDRKSWRFEVAFRARPDHHMHRAMTGYGSPGLAYPWFMLHWRGTRTVHSRLMVRVSFANMISMVRA